MRGAYGNGASSLRLLTPQFFLLCGFTFLAFAASFLLFPTMPFHILETGGRKASAGLFLGFVTSGSALSAPFAGTCADRFGRRPVLLASSAALLCLSAFYALAADLVTILLSAIVHGVCWAALLSSTAALMRKRTRLLAPATIGSFDAEP